MSSGGRLHGKKISQFGLKVFDDLHWVSPKYLPTFFREDRVLLVNCAEDIRKTKIVKMQLAKTRCVI